MPLFFAIATVLSMLLALVVLGTPVLLVVLVIKAVRGAWRPRPKSVCEGTNRGNSPSDDTHQDDEQFASLIACQWPAEGSALLNRNPRTD